jgi:hypothetical protein
VIVEVDKNGDEFKCLALNWADYFHKNPGAKGTTRGGKYGFRILDKIPMFNLKFLSNI